MPRRCRSCVPLLVLALIAGACDTQGRQDEFAEGASRPPSGFVRTDADGKILSDDPDDWRTAPLFVGKVRIDPAYPNPSSGGFVTISFAVLDFNAVRGGLFLRAFDDNRRFIRLDEAPEATQPGSYVFSFSPALLGRTGLHRLYVFDGFNEIVSYGDLSLE